MHHTASKQSNITNQLSSQTSKLLFYGFVICHFTQYHSSACVQPFLTCTWFEVATNKIAQFFGTGTGYVKLKKKHGNFSTTMETKLDIRPSSRVIKQIWSFNENVQTCWETYEVQMCSEFQENSLCLRKLSFFRIACLGDCWLNCWIGLRAFTAPEKSDITFRLFPYSLLILQAICAFSNWTSFTRL